MQVHRDHISKSSKSAKQIKRAVKSQHFNWNMRRFRNAIQQSRTLLDFDCLPLWATRSVILLHLSRIYLFSANNLPFTCCCKWNCLRSFFYNKLINGWKYKCFFGNSTNVFFASLFLQQSHCPKKVWDRMVIAWVDSDASH
jgi:hypothetical protein